MSLKSIGNITIFLSNNCVSNKKKLQHNDFQINYFSTISSFGLFFCLFSSLFFEN